MLEARFIKQLGAGENAIDLKVDLPSVKPGITGIFGPSGSGKTSLIRCIAGLTKADAGVIKLNEEVWQSESKWVPTHRRAIGYVFQESSLLNHFTVKKNIEYATQRVARINTTAYARILNLLGIESLLDLYPLQLSLGQQQRVAIACAVLSQPKVLLMDEPLASLDHSRKLKILAYIKEIAAELSIPILYVSHDLEEIAFLASNIVYVNDAKTTGYDSFQQFLSDIDHPLLIEQSLGGVLQVSVAEKLTEWSLVRTELGEESLWLNDNGLQTGQTLHVHVPAHQVGLSLQKPAQTSYLNILKATVISVSSDHQQGFCNVVLQVGGQTLYSRLTRLSASNLALAPGLPVYTLIKSASVLR